MKKSTNQTECGRAKENQQQFLVCRISRIHHFEEGQARAERDKCESASSARDEHIFVFLFYFL